MHPNVPYMKKYDSVNTILNNKHPDHVNGEKPAPRSNLFL